MSSPERVWLMQTPSCAEEGWRDALSHACSERGWEFLVQEPNGVAPTPTAGRPSLTTGWLDHTGDQAVTCFVVQYSTPRDSEAVLLEAGLSAHDALHESSMRFAFADALVRRGAGVAFSSDPVLSIPGLGDVAGPAGRQAISSRGPHPLDLYADGPTPANLTVRWSEGLFVYPGLDETAERDGVVSLLGRRRLLFNGPNIFLPPGVWRFQAEFSIDPGGVADLLIEWGRGYDVQALPVKIHRPGRYEVDMSYAWTEVAPADFRISLMTPMLGGVMEFRGGTLSRLADDAVPEATAATSGDRGEGEGDRTEPW